MEEYEINLVEMFRVIFRKFKYCVYLGLVFMLLLGGYKAYSTYQTINDPAKVEQSEKDYETALEEYEDKKEQLEKDIAKLELKIPNLDKYIQNSYKMEFDPYAVSISRREYAIDSFYKVNPGMSYQNKDMTSTLVSAYKLAMDSSEFFDYIIEDLNLDTESTYLDEIISIDDKGNGIVSIKVIGKDEEFAKSLSDSIEKYYAGIKSKIDDIAKHDITLYNTTLYTTVDESYITHQENKINDYNKQVEDLELKKTELADLKEPTKAELEGMKPVIKGFIKFGVVGFFVGGVLLGMLYAFGYLFNTKVCNEKELYDRYHVRVFGSVNVK